MCTGCQHGAKTPKEDATAASRTSACGVGLCGMPALTVQHFRHFLLRRGAALLICRCTMLRHAVPCYATLCHAMSCYATLCHAVLCNATLCHAVLCYATMAVVRLCHAPSLATVLKLLCAMLCYPVLCCPCCAAHAMPGWGSSSNANLQIQDLLSCSMHSCCCHAIHCHFHSCSVVPCCAYYCCCCGFRSPQVLVFYRCMLWLKRPTGRDALHVVSLWNALRYHP